jgi:hypothetical protein
MHFVLSSSFPSISLFVMKAYCLEWFHHPPHCSSPDQRDELVKIFLSSLCNWLSTITPFITPQRKKTLRGSGKAEQTTYEKKNRERKRGENSSPLINHPDSLFFLFLEIK